MNDWYIDRSKNFINPSLMPVLTFLSHYNGELDSASLISAFVDNAIFDEEAGNLNAALTRFRDHGFLSNNNKLGEPAIDFLDGKLSRDEVILDLLFKRPAQKKQSPNLKPLVLLCVLFDLMYEIAADANDVYLTYEECYKYLYCCDSLEDITLEYVDMIMNNRLTYSSACKLKQNEVTNLSIWYNALKSTPIFLPSDSRTVIRPNLNALPFIKYISINGRNISETPTHSNTALYDYYCSRNTGLSEIIPSVFKPNVIVSNDDEALIVYNYIMGIKIEPDFDFSRFFYQDCFGVFFPFMFVPGLVLRKIWDNNKALGAALMKVLKR